MLLAGVAVLVMGTVLLDKRVDDDGTGTVVEDTGSAVEGAVLLDTGSAEVTDIEDALPCWQPVQLSYLVNN